MNPVSVIVVTSGDSAVLPEALARIVASARSSTLECDLVLVDNSREGLLLDVEGWSVHRQLRPGAAGARNLGLRVAQGDALLFADDDVLVPDDWVRALATPVLEQGAIAVAGGVRISDSLLRPWMTNLHRAWLASTEWIDAASPGEMVSASMALSRRALSIVDGFDENLGPGTPIGAGGEDALLSWQLREAGHPIVSALGVLSEHRFNPSRLTRESFERAAVARGRVAAYQSHHWRHDSAAGVMARLARTFAGRVLAASPSDRRSDVPMPTLQSLFLRSYAREFSRLAGSPRNYDRKGLRMRP